MFQQHTEFVRLPVKDSEKLTHVYRTLTLDYTAQAACPPPFTPYAGQACAVDKLPWSGIQFQERQGEALKHERSDVQRKKKIKNRLGTGCHHHEGFVSLRQKSPPESSGKLTA